MPSLDSTEPSLPTVDGEAESGVFEEVLPSYCTWFHLAWKHADREIPLIETDEYEALRTALVNGIGNRNERVSEEISETLERRIDGDRPEREYNPETSDAKLLSDISADLSTVDFGSLGGDTMPVDVHANERNSGGTYTGSSDVTPELPSYWC